MPALRCGSRVESLDNEGGPGAPGGKFPADVTFDWPFGINQLGNLVFAAAHNGSDPFGTFLRRIP
jgi:hypothetical protein